jgi:S-adenosylmethionine-diacylglycerol 3-amino-3-carboxypropyl transferase
MKRSNVFEDVLYAQCWEDPELDRQAFRIRPGDTVFSITSGGCNALAFLADRPARVIAVDLNPFQNYLMELKIAAFRLLSYPEILEFTGVRQSQNREAIYRELRAQLSDESLHYWDGQSEKIRNGLIHCGRYERYMALLRTWTRTLMGRGLIEEFFEENDPDRRATLFHDRWDNAAWKLLTRFLLSRKTMTLLFDGAFFKFVEEDFSFGRHFSDRVEHAMTRLSLKDNPYLSYILLGRYYSEDHLPTYLRPENFDAIKRGIERVTVQTAGCDDYFRTLPDSTISHFNFTNIFEWISPEAFEGLLRETWRVGVSGAVLTYRNLLVHRERPESLSSLFARERDLARELHNRDRSFVYRNYVIERIVKEESPWHTMSEESAIAAR